MIKMQIKFRSESEFQKWYKKYRQEIDVTEANKNLVGGGVTVTYLQKGTSGRPQKARKKHIVVEMKRYRGE